MIDLQFLRGFFTWFLLDSVHAGFSERCNDCLKLYLGTCGCRVYSWWILQTHPEVWILGLENSSTSSTRCEENRQFDAPSGKYCISSLLYSTCCY